MSNFYWWFDDALANADADARRTGRRMRVHRWAGMWRVTEVGAA